MPSTAPLFALVFLLSLLSLLFAAPSPPSPSSITPFPLLTLSHRPLVHSSLDQSLAVDPRTATAYWLDVSTAVLRYMLANSTTEQEFDYRSGQPSGQLVATAALVGSDGWNAAGPHLVLLDTANAQWVVVDSSTGQWLSTSSACASEVDAMVVDVWYFQSGVVRIAVALNSSICIVVLGAERSSSAPPVFIDRPALLGGMSFDVSQSTLHVLDSAANTVLAYYTDSNYTAISSATYSWPSSQQKGAFDFYSTTLGDVGYQLAMGAASPNITIQQGDAAGQVVYVWDRTQAQIGPTFAFDYGGLTYTIFNRTLITYDYIGHALRSSSSSSSAAPSPPSQPSSSSSIPSPPPSCARSAVSYSGYDLPGNDLFHVSQSAVSFSDCAELCCQTAGCASFTVCESNFNDSVCSLNQPCCFLKYGTPALVWRNSSISQLASGIVAQSAPTCPVSSVLSGYDLPGLDLYHVSLPAVDFAQCQSLCCNELQCQSFTVCESNFNDSVCSLNRCR